MNNTRDIRTVVTVQEVEACCSLANGEGDDDNGSASDASEGIAVKSILIKHIVQITFYNFKPKKVKLVTFYIEDDFLVKIIIFTQQFDLA